MVARAPVSVILGGAAYWIRPLTLAQVEAIETRPLCGGPLRWAFDTVSVALARDHAEAIDDIGATQAEMCVAARAIVGMARMAIVSGDPKPGEARAARLTA